MARLKEFESPTFRLGGGRSIRLSYRRICDCIVPKKSFSVNKNRRFFRLSRHILAGELLRRCNMWERDDPMADLEDLLFDEEEGRPSER